MEEKDLKCFEFVCSRFPKCARAVTCCAVDDYFQDVTLKREQCFDFDDKPYYIERRKWRP